MFTFYVLFLGCKFVKNQNAKYMKEKILGKLKQAYSQLGLGDAILTAQAESLANSGFVTDENIDAIVAAQKPFLEGLQKANDSRVTEAVKKAKEKSRFIVGFMAYFRKLDVAEARRCCKRNAGCLHPSSCRVCVPMLQKTLMF